MRTEASELGRPSGASRLDSLTSLRFFAAASILVDHSQTFFTGFDRLNVFGESVTLFFILSGFVLTWSSAKASPGTFYWHRVARIYPLYLLTWLAGCLIAAHTGLDGTYDLHAGDFLQQLTLTQVWLPNHSIGGFDAPAWTLSVEWFFYLCFPLLVRIALRLPRWARRVVLLACAGAVLGLFWFGATTYDGAHLTNWFTNTCPLVRLPEFIIGILLALEVRDGLRVPWTIGVLACAAGMWWCWALSPAKYYPVQQAPTLVGFALLITAAASADVRGRRSPLRWRPLVVLGDCSFALFLIHWLVFSYVELLPKPSPYALFPHSSAILNVTMASVISLALAIVVHYGYEAPLNRVLRPLSAKVSSGGLLRRALLMCSMPAIAVGAACFVAVNAMSAVLPGPIQSNNFFEAGISAIGSGQYATAVADFQAASRLEPANVDAIYDLGVAEGEAGNTSAAIMAYYSTLNIDPTNTSAMFNLGIELAPTDPSGALSFFQEVIQLDPGNAEGYEHAGLLLQAMGEISQGRADLERAAELSSGG